jgi:membrane protease YdiL (CAAX protease family)
VTADLNRHGSLTAARRITLIAIVAAAYLIGFWPSWWLRDLVLGAFNYPPYEGVWILIPHLFLYSSLQAIFCLIAWTILVRIGWTPPPRLSLRRSTLGWGLGVGVLSAALIVAFFYATGLASAFHEPQIDPWIMLANLFSNFLEEYIYRGFFLAALAVALGFWPAVVLSSIAFGATHIQYPLELQVLITGIALIWAWSFRKGGGLLAPYTAHLTMDWLVDPFL